MKKMNETKVLRDPIHGYIHIDEQVIWDCLNAKEMQRLRRIHQLGGDFQVYHCAEHSRFAHSLGVYEIVRRIVQEIQSIHDALNEYDRIVLMLAGLLHDLGHGPFSHAFENVAKHDHESYTVDIILKDSEVHQILDSYNTKLSSDVASVIQYLHPKEFMNQIVSGELDADRMDYLLRDAYFTGTSYGKFDMERILRTLRLKENKIVVKQSGIHSVEDYIMARYHMYWQVYLHPIARSYEALIVSIFQRMKDLYTHGKLLNQQLLMFVPFLKEDATIHDLHTLDEAAAFYGFSMLLNDTDEILADLAYRILNRHLFDYEEYACDDDYARIKTNVQKLGYDANYYVYVDTITQKPYAPYSNLDQHHPIWVACNDGSIKELSIVSDIVSALVRAPIKEEAKIYYPTKRLK